MELTLIIGWHHHYIIIWYSNIMVSHVGGMICFGQMTLTTESGELN